MAKKDVTMAYIADDMQKVQVKTNLYIQKYGYMGVFHLAKEVIQNSIDELEDPDTNGSKIKITYDELDDKLTVEDDGRGIPEETYPIDITCTKLQSGSKFFRSQGGKSSGEFGVGITVVNAISSYFSLATYRNTYMHKISFKNGEKVDDENHKIGKGEKKHGTVTEFISNPTYLGKDTYLPFDILYAWLVEMSYQFSTDITIEVEKRKGLKTISKQKLKRKPFTEFIHSDIMVDQIGKKLYPMALNISGDAKIKEEVVENILDAANRAKAKKKKMTKDIHLDVTFAYTDNPGYYAESFCNFTKTTAGGVHLDSVEDVLFRFLQTKTKSYMTDKEKEKWDITWNDVKENLVVLVNLSTNAQVQFMGNAKDKIQNEELKAPLKEIVQAGLNDLLDAQEPDIHYIAKRIKQVARARVEAAKTRKASMTKRVDNFDELEITNYVPCNNTGKKYKELLLIEGEKSAAGSIVNGRDPSFQAIFGFKGVTKNPYKWSFDQIMENKEWANLNVIMKCGVGENFNLNKLYFDKIIIMTDADIDGFYIAMGICSYFALNFPEIVQDGRLYRVYSPLYNVDDKNHPFVQNKAEMIDILLKKIIKQYSVAIKGDAKKLSKDEFYEFLFDTVDYRTQMIDLEGYFKVKRYLIELIASILVEYGAVRSSTDYDDLKKLFGNQKFITTLMNRIQKKYPEVICKNQFVRGVIEGHYASVEVNDRFIKKIAPLIEIYQAYPIDLIVYEKKGDEMEMTIGEFLDMSYKLMPKILTRYKGLGEVNADQLEKTTLNPENRLLVRLTMKDCKKALDVFYKLQGTRGKDKARRKAMMEEYVIDPENLDS